MTQMLSNLPEAYKNLIENLYHKLDGEDDTLTIESNYDKLLDNYNRINV